MIVTRVLEPRPKLATARELDGDTFSSSLAEEVGATSADVDGLYEAMEWLLRSEERIEKSRTVSGSRT